ncbi:MAG: hypothetical protein ACR2LK_08560 [Solirubrobacteraceae bacterium]
MTAFAAHLPAHWRGALRIAVAILLVGALAVWLVKPIGDACPDLGGLPQGSTASSSPSFSPPLTRTCTYTAAGGTRATSRYVPVMDWFVLLLVSGAVALVVGAVMPAARAGRGSRPASDPRARGVTRGDAESRAAREPSRAPASGERDDAGRERARRERAERNRSRRES